MLSGRLQANLATHRPFVVAGMRLLGACWAPATVAALPAALSIRLSSGLVHLVCALWRQRGGHRTQSIPGHVVHLLRTKIPVNFGREQGVCTGVRQKITVLC